MASQHYSSSLSTSDDPQPDGLTLKIPATESYQLRLEQHQFNNSTTVSMDGVGSYSPDLEAFDFPGLTELPSPSQIVHDQGSQPQLPRQSKPRRRHSSSDAPKHRRTRSGCYTCRQRRVKCDEKHPICDRCRKGKRECTYPANAIPSPTTATSASSSHSLHGDGVAKCSTPDSHSSPSTYHEEDEAKFEPLSTIRDDAEGEAREEKPLPTPSSETRRGHRNTSAVGDANSASNNRPSPVEPRANRPQFQRSSSSRHAAPQDISSSEKWLRLPPDVAAHLRYHREKMTYHHYAFKYDSSNFLKTTFLEIALNDDSSALLYSIVAFAAYHHATHEANSNLSTFLSYYNKTVSLLAVSLQRRRYNTATLLTILQLATIEEYMGDWFYLHYHQRAALQILTEIYRAETIMQDETRRKIITWYFRFDIFAGLMAGDEPCLSRDWFLASANFYKQQALSRPNDLGAIFEDFFATSRLLATDIAFLFAAKKSRSISDAQFASGASRLTGECNAIRQRLESTFTEPSCFAPTPPTLSTLLEPSEADTTSANFLYGGEYFTMNFVLLDFWAIDLLFRYQLKMTQGLSDSSELLRIAITECKMIEAIQCSGEGPGESLLGCQASLGIVSLCVGSNKRLLEWCCQKYAIIEKEGYVYPASLRERMSRLWGLDLTRWWLPYGQGHSRIIQSIRDFVEFRRDVPRNMSQANLRDMTGLFRFPDANSEDITPGDPKTARVDSGHAQYAPGAIWYYGPEPVTTSG